MKTYYELLETRAFELDIKILKAFAKAGVPSSTYYRAKLGRTAMRYETAMKVLQALEDMYEESFS